MRPQHSLVPLLAFDDDGYRLGYGGGFYDRTLAALRGDGAGPFLAIGVGAQRAAALAAAARAVRRAARRARDRGRYPAFLSGGAAAPPM